MAQIQIDDPDEYQNYLAGFMPIFERHGGELLATSKNQTIVVEGSRAYPSTVIMKFPSVELTQAWCDDPDLTVQVLGNHCPVRVVSRAFYDPANNRCNS